MDIKIITEEDLHKDVVEAIPNFIDDLVKVSNSFNKCVSNPNNCQYVEHLLGSIICINEGKVFNELSENILISLKDAIKMFYKATYYYFKEVEKNIDSAIEDKSKNNLDNMSREELIQYIKKHKL
jgi:hypothetical protein